MLLTFVYIRLVAISSRRVMSPYYSPKKSITQNDLATQHLNEPFGRNYRTNSQRSPLITNHVF